MKSSILKLKLYSVLIGLSVGMLELYIGHRFILDKLLIGRDYNFVYESFFAPTYYGLTKSFIVAVVFFLVSLFAPKNKTNPIIVGILGAADSNPQMIFSSRNNFVTTCDIFAPSLYPFEKT